MKAKLLKEVHGMPVGSEVDIIARGANTATVAIGSSHVTVSTEDIGLEAQEPAKPKPEPQPLVPRLQVDDETEDTARRFYDDYTSAVGGIAFNGEKLPSAEEFFEDETKQKQANAWRTVAGNALEHLHAAGVLVTDEPVKDEPVKTQKPTSKQAKKPN